jgi:hypothetical protein
MLTSAFSVLATESAEIDWIRQFGTQNSDNAEAIFADVSGEYAAGGTHGTLPGQASAGSRDAFLRRYDHNGNDLWTHQFGTTGDDASFAVWVESSGVFVAGAAGAALPGQVSAGDSDAFVRKYDADGNELWTRQFGSGGPDASFGITGGSSGVYVVGITAAELPGQTSVGAQDAFLRKYDGEGNEVWTRQFGTTSHDQSWAVSVDSSGVYVAGITFFTGDSDAFLSKFDHDGNAVWTRQFGIATDQACCLGVSVNSFGVFVAGTTGGTLPGEITAGGRDGFLRKYDQDGDEVWTRQFGTAAHDHAVAVAAESSGVYVAGNTYGSLPGQVSAGDSDAFVRKYDAGGNEVWTHQFGTTSHDVPIGVSVDSSRLYAAGATVGTLAGQTSAGGQDAFIVKLIQSAPTPGPTTATPSPTGSPVAVGGIVTLVSDHSPRAEENPGHLFLIAAISAVGLALSLVFITRWLRRPNSS